MNVIIKAMDIEQFCRICFSSTSDMVSCFTKLINGDVSCTIADILNILSSEQTIEDTGQFPKQICLKCRELVNTVFNLKITLEKTSQLLKTWFYSPKLQNRHNRIKTISNGRIAEDCDNENIINFESSDEDIDLQNTLSSNCDKNQVISDDKSVTVQTQDQNIVLNFACKHKAQIDNKKLKKSANFRKKSSKKKRIYYRLALTNYNHICPFCRLNLPNAKEVKKHALSHRTLKKYLKGKKIPDNARFFSTPRETNSIFSKGEILHKCLFCREKITIQNFWKHIAEHNQEKEFKCNKCSRVFRKRNHLNSHITYAHLEELPYKCDNCNKGFVIKENYEAHLLTHSNPEVLPYKCDKCHQYFTNKKHLYYHSFKHTQYGSFSARYKTHRCSTCLRTFDTAEDLQEHHIEYHNRKRKTIEIKVGEDGLYRCEYCTKTYEHVEAFKYHIRRSHGPKKLCSLCGATVLNLKQHLISHQDKKDPLECHICHRLLASKLTLSRHIRVHTGEKPYKCSFCEKSFKDHYPMKVHERIHKGEKKHICTVCGKRFLEKAYMLKHLRVHNK